jgi:hypothetical protein
LNKKVAIVQSCYIPWKGFFDMIHEVDEFVLYDDMQYTRRDWRNRNQIKTKTGPQWLTIPVEVKGKFSQAIKDTKVANHGWAREHWKTICHNYADAPHFGDYKKIFEETYLACEREDSLSRVNEKFLKVICGILEIKTKISWSMDYSLAEGKTERLVELCKTLKADAYLSGPSAAAYIVGELFEKAGIRLEYMDYTAYPSYRQLFGDFVHEVSILDLLFNEGPQAPRFMKSF